MQQYPVEFSYDKTDGAMYLGLASTAADAVDIYNGSADVAATSAELTQVEVGGFKTLEDAEAYAATQIGASPANKVWSGYVVYVETWSCK